jgi:class 3 adenylate cyclase
MREPREGGGHPITILFTDVQGSTQLRARHGDRVADEILHDHEGIVRRAVEAHGGDEAAFLGDGFMVTFASPADGLRCAVAIQGGEPDAPSALRLSDQSVPASRPATSATPTASASSNSRRLRPREHSARAPSTTVQVSSRS